MSTSSRTLNAPQPLDAAVNIELRHADSVLLPEALNALRARLLTLWGSFQRTLAPDMSVRFLPELNPPRWELGHIAWFEEYWTARNPQRHRGHRADPKTARAASVILNADALYDSSLVSHATRWHLDLPDAQRTVRLAQQVREKTLSLLRQAGSSDDELYFFRLAAVHEAMHLEAWLYMAQHLALDLRDTGLRLTPGAVNPCEVLAVPDQPFTLGSGETGFAFDNEWSAHEVAVASFELDSVPVTWGRYLPFVESGGYDDQRHWTSEGWAWRQRHSNGKPRHLLREDEHWKRAAFGQWQPLNPDEPALHLSAHEAHAWCAWAGRRLPTEAEWECAAVTCGQSFTWGQVWEWTSSRFEPYPGFEAHPYLDYSQPWFDGRPVLRGSSFATWPGLRDLRYRNFFPADRNDIFSGFRSCAV